MQRDTAELRIDYDEVLRQHAIPQQSTVDACQRRGAVEPVREVCHVAICNPLIGCSESSQRLRPCQRRAIHCADTRDIESIQDSIEKRRISSSPGRVERLEDAVLENVCFIQFQRTPKL